jgi:hypothetical protein
MPLRQYSWSLTYLTRLCASRDPDTPPPLSTACANVLLLCIRGRVVAQLPNDLVEMENIMMPLADLPSGQTIQATIDETLMNCLCQLRNEEAMRSHYPWEYLHLPSVIQVLFQCS